MSDPTDLVEWLSACYDRAEQRARWAAECSGGATWRVQWHDETDRGAGVFSDGVLSDEGSVISSGEVMGPPAEHIADHDPAWRLGDIARKRKILDDIVPAATGLDVDMDTETGQTYRRDLAANPYLGDRLLRLLAEEFASEPGYQEAWRR